MANIDDRILDEVRVYFHNSHHGDVDDRNMQTGGPVGNSWDLGYAFTELVRGVWDPLNGYFCGGDLERKKIEHDGDKFIFEFESDARTGWDAEDFMMRRLDNLKMVAILFAPFGEDSWGKAKRLVKELKDNPSFGPERPMVLVACKCDVKPTNCKIVEAEEYKSYAESFGMPVFEFKAHCSAEEAMAVMKEMALYFRSRSEKTDPKTRAAKSGKSGCTLS